ncbi:methionyl-tRNA formyltransferase [Pseudonocardia hierapolitana]|uniref:Methionyl-tRNA formyltransferase n=1 Tax=Pseudonocardia hierapolitana TaxID=1128676 RepID=A0A561SVY4_9PSEU|nr:PIG-L family deacetylase [Pseudonocardia hierapolitana]TWF79024.1 methionyl-tRNA formyltransferase [Pseudonocardia hierapolitana]
MSAETTAGPAPRVVFIGGLDDGRRAVEVLLRHPRADLVAAFVLDDSEASRVSGFRAFDDLVEPGRLRKIRRIKHHVDEIRELAPDVIIVVGFSQVIPPAILDVPPGGVIGFHSAVLPGRRGCSPLIWAMVDGLTETGISMFYMDEGIDTGDVIAVERFAIEEDDDAADVLRKADDATVRLLERHLDAVLDGTAPRTPQPEGAGTYTRRRTPADGEIDWTRPAHEVVNLIRALAPPYPVAHTYAGDGVPVLIEKARAAPELQLPPPRRLQHDPMYQQVLCVVAHPDDETLGVGGTLALHAEAGSEVTVVIMSEGEEEKLAHTPRCETRRECALAAAEELGIATVEFHDFPDQRLDSVPFIELIKTVEAAIGTHRPTVIYTHHGGDANTDHQVVFKAVYAASRPMTPLGSTVSRFLTFETPSSTDQAPQVGDYVFNPTTYIDVESVWDRKVKALECYPTEMIGGRHPRSFEYIEALARVRGGHSGYMLAEGFVSVRERLTRPVFPGRA